MRPFHLRATKNSLRASIGATALLAALGVQPLAAQAEPTAGSGSTPSANAATAVGEVVVTASKRSQLVREVPGGVTAISATQLQAAGVLDPRDIVGFVPGLQVASSLGAGEFVLRGLTTGNDINPTVGLQIDGAPIGPVAFGAAAATQLPEIDPALMSRVEVLRGPQGTLYGGSTLGGIVNYVTQKPSLETMTGTLYAEGSDTNRGGGNFVGRALFSAPLVQDKLGLQLSGFDDQFGGFINDPLVGKNKFDTHSAYGGRVALLWQVNPDFQVQLADLNSNEHSYGDALIYNLNGTPNSNGLTYSAPVLPFYNSRFNMVSLNAAYNLHWATLSYIGTYQTLNTLGAGDFGSSKTAAIIDGFLPLFGGPVLPASPNLGVFTGDVSTKTTHEIRLASPDEGSIRWLAGLFYNSEHTASPEIVSSFNLDQSVRPAPLDDLIDFSLLTHLQEYAGFADVTYYVTPKLDVTGGVRVGYITQNFEQLYSGSDATPLNTLFVFSGLLPTPADTGVSSSHETFETYLADVRYHLTSNDMIYFRFATGFRPGGPNVVVPGLPATFGPDTTKNYEVGWKTTFWDGRGYLDLDLYDVEWNNIQILTQSQGIGGETNGGQATSRGVEATVALRPIEGFNLGGSVTYSDAHLDDNIPALGASGDAIPNNPKWSGSITAEYTWLIQDKWHGFVGGSARYNGQRLFTFEHSTTYPEYTLPAYTIVDLRIGVRHDNTELVLFVRNAGDARDQLGDSSQGVNYVTVGRPRTIGASLSAHF